MGQQFPIQNQPQYPPESRYPLAFKDINVKTPEGTVALDAYVQYVVIAINTRRVNPLGDYGGPNLYYFQTFDNGLGNLVYTIFDRSYNTWSSKFYGSLRSSNNNPSSIIWPNVS
jgi:hypothetical protein